MIIKTIVKDICYGVKKVNLYCIGQNIKYYRTDKHLSQEALAEKTDLSAKYISHLELGNRVPSVDSLIKIANALEISSDLLLFDLVDDSFNDKNCYLNSKISKLSKENQKVIHSVIETLIAALE